MSNITELPRLSNNTREYVGRVPFYEDKLDRKKLAEKLTTYLDRLNDGAVLAIDAPWGEGKTWFARNWEADLIKNEYKTIYIDAFEQDYVDEPFILLASELMEMIKENGSENDNKEFKKTAIQIAKSTLSIGTKVGINLATRVFLGNVDLNEEIEKSIEEVGSSSADNVSKFIEDKFDNYKNEKEAKVEFKKVLNAYSSKQEKPIVIFIDELDRCKPTFAVNLIERIKHYFDVPNVVFILQLNKEQLENAIKGVYGINTDASKYLDKFINFYFNLPKNNSSEYNEEIKMTNFIKMTMSKYKFESNKDSESFILWLNKWIPYFKLSLRDIEKCIALYAFAFPLTIETYHLVYFIVLKVKKPKLFNALVNNDLDAHREIKEFIDKFKQESESKNDSTFSNKILPIYSEWHQAHISNFVEIGEEFEKYESEHWGIYRKDLFKTIASKIDINIER